MLAYPDKRSHASSKPSPTPMRAIIVGHIAVVAAVMSAKMELPPRIVNPPIIVDFLKDPPPPPTHETRQTPQRQDDSRIDQTQAHVRTAPLGGQVADNGGKLPDFG